MDQDHVAANALVLQLVLVHMAVGVLHMKAMAVEADLISFLVEQRLVILKHPLAEVVAGLVAVQVITVVPEAEQLVQTVALVLLALRAVMVVHKLLVEHRPQVVLAVEPKVQDQQWRAAVLAVIMVVLVAVDIMAAALELDRGLGNILEVVVDQTILVV